MSASSQTILVVGDMHGQWQDADREFLERGDQELVLFVGDLGDEDVDVVRQVAATAADKAVVLGNHDAWQSFSRRKPTAKLRDSLESLGEDHLGYAIREVPAAAVSIIGCRPFSWGGASMRSAEVYEQLYGVGTMRASAERIVDLARRAQHRDLVLLAHNGPAGLSSDPQDIYGKDFGTRVGGDWGDPDLEIALAEVLERGLRVPCVIAGHMHDRVMVPRGGVRTRFVRRGDTLFVNPAVVPRIRNHDGVTLAHYVRLEFSGGAVQSVDEIWVDRHGEIRHVEEPRIVEI